MSTFTASSSQEAERSAGFTLLEAIVAMVVFSAAAMALYGLFNTNLVALGRAHDVTRENAAVHYAVEYLAGINPHDENSGQMSVDGIDIAWTAKLLEPVRQSQTATGERGYFEVGLYEVVFEPMEEGESLGTWRRRVPGYRKVRGLEP